MNKCPFCYVMGVTGTVYSYSKDGVNFAFCYKCKARGSSFNRPLISKDMDFIEFKIRRRWAILVGRVERSKRKK